MTRDLRKFQQQTSLRLVLGFIAILFILGELLIWLFFGSGAALMGLICLLAAFVPVILIWGILAGMDWFVRRADQD